MNYFGTAIISRSDLDEFREFLQDKLRGAVADGSVSGAYDSKRGWIGQYSFSFEMNPYFVRANFERNDETHYSGQISISLPTEFDKLIQKQLNRLPFVESTQLSAK